MWFWRLLAWTAGAALLGWAISRLVGPRLPEILMRPLPAHSAPPVDGGWGPDGGRAPEAVAESTGSEATLDSPSALGPKGATRDARSGRAGGDLAEQLARGIRRIGEGRFEIKRGALELALRNLPRLAAWVRVAPAVHEGRPSGFRVVAVTGAGPFAKLGLRRDDVLVSVNGLDIRTPDAALEAYAKLKAASRFALGFLRDGQAMVHEYTIR